MPFTMADMSCPIRIFNIRKVWGSRRKIWMRRRQSGSFSQNSRPGAELFRFSFVHAALDSGAGTDAFEPAFHIGKIVDVLALPLPVAGPTETSNVGDRIFTREIFPVRQAPVHHTVKPVHFRG